MNIASFYLAHDNRDVMTNRPWDLVRPFANKATVGSQIKFRKLMQSRLNIPIRDYLNIPRRGYTYGNYLRDSLTGK